MGNCLIISNSKVAAQDNEKHESAVEKDEEAIERTVTPLSKMKKKKRVRFNLEEDYEDGGDRGMLKTGSLHEDESNKNGVVRIRLVMTQEELKRLLDYKDDDDDDDSISNRVSVEQLLSSLKSRSKRVSTDQNGIVATNQVWKPVLESISEDQC